ncbi:MAG TPA: sulfotransferase [Phycisphaerales bacterium]|nr:sulfotransferase [Phycisphaerales bacterium]
MNTPASAAHSLPLDRNPPDFVIIGAMKAGTTSLHDYLSVHPQLCMSSEKDISYFSARHNWHRGPQWYRSLFADPSRLMGETSVGYSQYPGTPGVPEKILAANPNVKIIYLVRDPIRRIISHYMHNVAHNRETRTIDETLVRLDRNHYLNSSLYYFQLQQYLALIDPSRILVLASESLSADRSAVLRRIFSFLGVDPHFTSPNFDRVLHETRHLRRNTALGSLLDRVPLLSRLKTRVPFTGRAVPTPVLSKEVRIRLARALRDDITALSKFTDDSYAAWITYDNAITELLSG